MTENINGFDEVYGHDNVKKVLKNALATGHVGHAYIFSGIKGVGKYSMARAFAGEIVGTKFSEHPDIITVNNEWCDVVSKSGAILADTAKAMRKDIYIMPYSSDRKVYIVPNADTMNVTAQNSILKVFEEPPLYCTIILLAENSNKFLQTILSRATEIRFSPLPINMVAKYLTEKLDIEPTEAAAKAIMSEGSIGRAIEISDSTDTKTEDIRREAISQFLCLSAAENRVIFDFSKFLKSHKDDMNFIFAVLKSFLDDLVHLKFGLSDNIVNVDKLEELKKLSGVVTKHAAVQFVDITLKYERVVASNANFRIAMFCMACEYWEEIHGRNYRSSI